jgi:hypothetical protein
MPIQPPVPITADEWSSGATVEISVVVEVPHGVTPAEVLAALEAALPDAENCGPDPDRPWVVEFSISAKHAICGRLLA